MREALDILSTRMTEAKVEEALLEARAASDKPMERALAVYGFGAVARGPLLDVLCTDENEVHAFDRPPPSSLCAAGSAGTKPMGRCFTTSRREPAC